MVQQANTQAPVWRGMTRAELDAAYNNSAAVPNSAAKIAEWTERSARLRARRPKLLDLAYGPRERNRIDAFRSGVSEAPLLVFVHGGYWQRNSKEIFACMTEGVLAHGWDAALIGYTLAPSATITEIVAEVRAAVRWLRNGGVEGVGRDRLVVSGWSAGGHLAAMLMEMPKVDGGLAISGIFDLEPCRLNYLNEKLGLTEAEARLNSPILRTSRATGPFVVAYGTAELPELQRQSREYEAALSAHGGAGRLLPLPAHDHFSILEELACPNGALTHAVTALALGTSPPHRGDIA